MKTQTIIALKFLLVMTILTGIVYPLLMTGMAQLGFPSKANGSLIMKDGKIIGSELIGQKFDSSIYFWSRPSFIGYNPVPSGASNYGPTSDTLKKQVGARRILFAKMNSLSDPL
jgi:K+-transporting ATPase ATPase C chain